MEQAALVNEFRGCEMLLLPFKVGYGTIDHMGLYQPVTSFRKYWDSTTERPDGPEDRTTAFSMIGRQVVLKSHRIALAREGNWANPQTVLSLADSTEV